MGIHKMTFDEWLSEVEVYSSRHERLYADFENLSNEDIKTLMKWLEAAYNVGYEEGGNHE